MNRTFQYVVLGVAATIVVSYVSGMLIVKERLSDLTAEATLAVATQLTTVSTLSEVMARGGVDAVTDNVIKDCAPNERNRFDELLGRLSTGLGQAELTELSRLFDRCAPFYSRQKAVMAARLEREVEVYGLLTTLLVRINPQADIDQYAVGTWKELATFEQDQSELFNRLVALQGTIIDTLQNGNAVSSPEISTLLKEVSEVVQMQTYNSSKISELRASLPTSL